MGEWYDNQKKLKGDWRKRLQERLDEKTPKRREVASKEQQRLSKLEGILSGENVQNRQLSDFLKQDNI